MNTNSNLRVLDLSWGTAGVWEPRLPLITGLRKFAGTKLDPEPQAEARQPASSQTA